jgi:hypothetical protein
MTITNYRHSEDIDVQFDDGSIVKNRTYDNFKHGGIKHPYLTKIALERIGTSAYSSKGEKMTIVAYRSCKDIDIKFEDGTVVKNRTYQMFRTGQIENPNFKKNRIGKTKVANNGQKMTIVAYRNSMDIDVQFEDNTVVTNTRYSSFKSGKIANPNFNQQKIGETAISNSGHLMTIIAYHNFNNIDIQFEDGTVVTNKHYGNFKNGRIAHPKHIVCRAKKKDRTGEIRTMKNGQKAKIISYESAKNISIRFDNGDIYDNVSYFAFKSGWIPKQDKLRATQ